MSTVETKHIYRATFILDTRNYQQPVETLIEKLTSVIESIKGLVQKVNNLGQKDFVRVTNRKFPAGIYLEVLFEGPPTAPSALKEKLKLDKTVNRVLVETL